MKVTLITFMILASTTVFAQESEFERGYKAGLASCGSSQQTQTTWTCTIYTKGYNFEVNEDKIDQYWALGLQDKLVGANVLESYIASAQTKAAALGEASMSCKDVWSTRWSKPYQCQIYKSVCTNE